MINLLIFMVGFAVTLGALTLKGEIEERRRKQRIAKELAKLPRMSAAEYHETYSNLLANQLVIGGSIEKG